MGVWVRGLVLALGVLVGCTGPSPTEVTEQSRIGIYLFGNGWGFRHSWVIREDDTVSEYSYSPDLDIGTWGFLDNGERKTSGVAQGAYDAVKALMEELDFANLEALCGGPQLVQITDAGDMVIVIRENETQTTAAESCGNGDRLTTPEYDAAWEAIERAIKGFVEQGAGSIRT